MYTYQTWIQACTLAALDLCIVYIYQREIERCGQNFAERSFQSTVNPWERRMCIQCRGHRYLLPISPTNATTWAPHSLQFSAIPLLLPIPLSLSFFLSLLKAANEIHNPFDCCCTLFLIPYTLQTGTIIWYHFKYLSISLAPFYYMYFSLEN